MHEKVTIKMIAEKWKLKNLTPQINLDSIVVHHAEVNRPALQLAGFFIHFDHERIQLIGNVENRYVQTLDEKTRTERYDQLFSYHFPALVVCRGLTPSEYCLQAAAKYQVPVLQTDMITTDFMAEIIRWLKVKLAPSIRIHGVLMDVFGEGVLITGESGVGKSETALELIKRGHRLVADDAVDIYKVSDDTLVGSAPEMLKYFIELRGIGIIDVKNLYGVGCVKETGSIDMEIHMEEWDRTKEYDRLGMDDHFTDYLGNALAYYSIPVRPGRNLAMIVETAAMNHRQKKSGYNAAQALYERTIHMQMEEADKEKKQEQKVHSRLAALCGESMIKSHEPMSRHTTFRVGGPADYYVTPATYQDLTAAYTYCLREQIPCYVIGNGSNLLVSDMGFRGVILSTSQLQEISFIEEDGTTILRAGAGVKLGLLAAEAQKRGLAGLAFAAGIPGTLGGAVYMNAGAYGGEMKDLVRKVHTVSLTGVPGEMTGEEMEFAYRSSRAMTDQLIILDAELVLKPGDPEAIRAEMEDYQARRQEKQPLEYPSAGSTFKRPEGHYAGKLIEDSGLAGLRVGGASVSTKHCGFIINDQNATAADIYTLCNKVSRAVEERFGVKLSMEVKIVGKF